MEYLTRAANGRPTGFETEARQTGTHIIIRQDHNPAGLPTVTMTVQNRDGTTTPVVLFTDEALDLSAALAVCTPSPDEPED